MTDQVMTPTTFRITNKLLKDLTRAAHRHEVSRTQYVQRALSEAVAQEHSGYDIALDIVREMIDALRPDTLGDGSPNQDLILKTAFETILPQLRGDV